MVHSELRIRLHYQEQQQRRHLLRVHATSSAEINGAVRAGAPHKFGSSLRARGARHRPWCIGAAHGVSQHRAERHDDRQACSDRHRTGESRCHVDALFLDSGRCRRDRLTSIGSRTKQAATAVADSRGSSKRPAAFLRIAASRVVAGHRTSACDLLRKRATHARRGARLLEQTRMQSGPCTSRLV